MTAVRIAGSFLILALWSAPATAQSPYPRVELFGGYSLLPADGDDFPRGTSHGAQVSVTANLTRWFGITGDVGVHTGTETNLGPGFAGRVAHTRVTELLVGPRFSARFDSVTPFVTGWFGVINGDAGQDFSGFSDQGLAFGGGAGVDIHLRPAIALRAQFDLLGTFADIVEGNTRFAAGVVLGLGR